MFARPSSLINTEDHSLNITWKVEELGTEESASDIFITIIMLEAQTMVLQHPDPNTYVIQIKYPTSTANQVATVIQYIDNDESEEERVPSNASVEEIGQDYDDDLETIRKISVTATSSNPFSAEYILNGCLSYNSMHNNATQRIDRMTSYSTWHDILKILDTGSLQFKILEPQRRVGRKTFY